ncbi:MAG: IS200/IS605 family transposase [Bacteroidetes bacterium]|nr:IS200/IS605 family transposase [Bacteroidota bacterium]
MPYIKIWIHTVWATKDRQPYLNNEIRQNIFQHIRENAAVKGIHLDHINGYTEHVHCLVSLSAEQNIATVMNLLKGESSFWINKNKLIKTKFNWQDEYFAVSIGHSQIESVRKYIREQETHHKKKTFSLEYDEFIEKYGFEVFKG